MKNPAGAGIQELITISRQTNAKNTIQGVFVEMRLVTQ